LWVVSPAILYLSFANQKKYVHYKYIISSVYF